jgi:hypothetical protein
MGEEPKEHLCMSQIATALAQQTPLANAVFSLINHDRPHLFPVSVFALVAVTVPSGGWPPGALRWICTSPLFLSSSTSLGLLALASSSSSGSV